MTQATDYSVPIVGPSTPTAFAQRIDDNFDAFLTWHSGAARPAYAVAGTFWEDTSVANEVRVYFYDGAQDILMSVVDTQNDRVELAPQPLVDVASAATTDIGAVKTRNIRVTGSVAITSFGSIRAGTTKTLYFAAALTVTYNAVSLITPTGANLVMAAGDSVDVVSLGGGNWRVLRVTSAANKGDLIQSIDISSSVASIDILNLGNYSQVEVEGWIVPASATTILGVVSTDNGATWITSANYSFQGVQASSGSGSFPGNAGQGAMQLTAGGNASNAASAPTTFKLTMDTFNQARELKGRSEFETASSLIMGVVAHRYTGTVARNALRLIAGTGNISAASLRVRGRI